MIGDKSLVSILEKQGWTMRFIAGEPRLSEAVEMYRDSGFEVLLEPLPKGTPCDDCAGEEGECRVCFEGFEEQYKMIFTRHLKDREKEEKEGLF